MTGSIERLVPVVASSAISPSATAIDIWTLIIAAGAVLVTVFGALLVRRTGKGTVEAAKQAAAASERSAQAAEMSAQAAQESVGVNRETATGVAMRAQEDALAKRYQDAAEQLGHERAPVRLAGAYAMARLADDWVEQRQTCIDVLCAYLRMPLEHLSATTGEQGAELEVRTSIFGMIASRVRRLGEGGSWQECDFDLRGASVINLNWSGLEFIGNVDFSSAKFTRAQIHDCMFKSGVSFRKCIIQDGLSSFSLLTHGGAPGDCRISFEDAIVAATGIAEFSCSSGGEPHKTRFDLTALQIYGCASLRLFSGRQAIVHYCGFHLFADSHLEIILLILPNSAEKPPMGPGSTWTVDIGASIYLTESLLLDDSWNQLAKTEQQGIKIEIFDSPLWHARPWRREFEIWRYI